MGIAEQIPGIAHGGEEHEVAFPELLIVLARHKSFILKFVLIVMVLTAIVAWGLLHPRYTAETKILPPQQSQSIAAAAASQLGPLAALAGSGLGLRNSSELYVSMLRSDTIADAMIDRFSLMKKYDARYRVDARRQLRDKTEIITQKDGIMALSIEDRDPRLAAEMANAYFDELEKLTKYLAVSEAGKRRIFYEQEVRMASDELAAAELALKQTQEKTGVFVLDTQARAAIESLASLRATVASLEIQIQSMRAFAASENPELIRAEQELAATRVQVARLEKGSGGSNPLDLPVEHVPTAALEYLRKLRDVRYREALYQLVARQYEAARIDEGKNNYVIQQLDKASVPEKKSWPHRSTILLIAMILAFLVSTGWVFLREAFERARGNPRFLARLQLFQFYLLGRRR